jgi:hypothetical protein
METRQRTQWLQGNALRLFKRQDTRERSKGIPVKTKQKCEKYCLVLITVNRLVLSCALFRVLRR